MENTLSAETKGEKSVSSSSRKILMNTFSQIAAKVVIGGFSIVILKLLTTYLGISGYGFYKSIYDFLALFAIVADMGLYTIGVREMTKHPENEDIVLGNLMTIRTVLIVLITGVAIISSLFISKFQGTIAPLAIGIAATASVFAILTGTISTALQVHLKIEYNSIASVIGKLAALSYIVFVIFFWFPHNCGSELIGLSTGNGACKISDQAFLQLIMGGVIGNIVMFLSTSLYVRKLVKISYRLDWSFMKDVIWKALPYGLALILNQIYFRIGSFMLIVMVKGPDAVAIYSAPLTMLEAAGVIPLYFMNAILPFLTRSIQEKTGRHKKIIQYAFDFLMIVSLPIVFGTIAIAYQLVYLITTPEFLSNWSIGFFGSDLILQILIVALFFSFLNGLFGYILLACDQQGKMLWRNLVGALLAIFITWLLIPYLGPRGSAIANVITEFYVCVVTYLLAKKYVSFKLNLRVFRNAFFSAIIMMGIVFLIKDWVGVFMRSEMQKIFHENRRLLVVLAQFGASVLVGAIVYIGLLIITKTLTPDMMNMIKKRKIVPSKIAEASAVEKDIFKNENPD